ncbi:MAG: BON domain-containing protein [Planctomycetia bacterium]|nr:BON domain-containing protein [Planctomycetia bacterium]
MTIRKALATILGCILAGAAFGSALGYGIGKLAPEYYRAVFHAGMEPGFDPVSVGIGLGLTQGAPGGLFIGLVLVALFCWREIRLHPTPDSAHDPASQQPKSLARLRWLVAITWTLLAIGICSGAGFILGGLWGEQGAYNRQYRNERGLISAEIAGDPAFAAIEIVRASSGGVYLYGEVATPADLERLRSLVARVLGESRAAEIVAVTVRR